MPLRCADASSASPHRGQNEDAHAADAARGVFIVADGKGARAGRHACEALARLLAQGRRAGAMHAVVENALREANELLFRQGGCGEDIDAATATAVVAVFEARRVVFGHVGDCRAYLYRAGRLRPATSDHTLVLEQLREGLITPHEAMQSPQQRIVLRALGAEAGVVPDVSTFEVRDGDIVLLCSDGLSDAVDDAAIERILERYGDDLEAASCELVAAARRDGGSDDVTVLLIQAHAEAGKGVLSEPAGVPAPGSGFPAAVLVSVLLAVLLMLSGGALLVRLGDSAPEVLVDDMTAAVATAPAREAERVVVAAPTTVAVAVDAVPARQAEVAAVASDPAEPAQDQPPAPTPTMGPDVYEAVARITQEFRHAVRLPFEQRATYLRAETFHHWGAAFVAGETVRAPFAPPTRELKVTQRIWRGKRGGVYLLEVVEPPLPGGYLAEIALDGERWTVAVEAAPPTRTPPPTWIAAPTRPRTPAPLAMPASPAPPPAPTDTPPPAEEAAPALPPQEAAERALKQFVEQELLKTLRASSAGDLDPLLRRFSPGVAAQQYRYHAGGKPHPTTLKEILRRYAESPTPTRFLYLGVSGARMTEARARVLFAVRYDAPRAGRWTPVYDLHDVDMERIGGSYRIARIYRYSSGLESLPALDRRAETGSRL